MYKSVIPGLVVCINLFYLDWYVYKFVLPGLVCV